MERLKSPANIFFLKYFSQDVFFFVLFAFNLHAIQNKDEEVSSDCDSWWKSKLNGTHTTWSTRLSPGVQQWNFSGMSGCLLLIFELRICSHVFFFRAVQLSLFFWSFYTWDSCHFLRPKKKSIQHGTKGGLHILLLSRFYTSPLFYFWNCSHLHHNILHDTKKLYSLFPWSSV